MELSNLLECMSDYDTVTIFNENCDKIFSTFVAELKLKKTDLLTARVTHISKSRTDICIFIDEIEKTTQQLLDTRSDKSTTLLDILTHMFEWCMVKLFDVSGKELCNATVGELVKARTYSSCTIANIDSVKGVTVITIHYDV